MKSVNERGTYEINVEECYENINIKGELSINTNINVENLTVKGEIISDRFIKCNNICNLKGKIKLKNIEANILKTHGRINAKKIKGNNIKIISSRNSKIEELLGDEILIKNGTNDEENEKNMQSILKLFKIDIEYKEKKEKTTFKIDKISGGNIELIGITSTVVIGNNIIIGVGCKIEQVRYTNSIKIDDNAQVAILSKEGE